VVQLKKYSPLFKKIIPTPKPKHSVKNNFRLLKPYIFFRVGPEKTFALTELSSTHTLGAIKGGGRILQMRTSAFSGAKTLDFSKFMGCPHGKGRLSQCGHFSGKGVGINFRDFLWTSFINGSLWLTVLALSLA